MNKRQLPKETLAKNLRYLMDMEELSETATGKKCGISQKAINKILNLTSSATIDTVEKIASGFGLSMWHLIMPNLPAELINDSSIDSLYNNYKNSTQKGREYIAHVAEREAGYKTS